MLKRKEKERSEEELSASREEPSEEIDLWKEPGEHIPLENDSDEDEVRKGVLYVGRIPYGFFEEQLKQYFSQFGEVTRIRLSRNKKVFYVWKKKF